MLRKHPFVERAHRMRPWAMVHVLGFLATACGDSGTDANQNNQPCPAGYEGQGPACVPLFDECPGAAEVPVLGGGCRPIGVLSCAAGFTEDGAGGCDPVLPEAACPVGAMPIIGQAACQPVGIPACGVGFAADGAGGCDPVLPAGPCPVDAMEVLGATTCQPIGDCGAGTWGNVVPDTDTVFVDQSYTGGGSDGSQGAPFLTVGEALAVVVAEGQIAVAEGDYSERLIVTQPVRLSGRCAERVILRGEIFLGNPQPALNIQAGGAGSTVRGVTLTGDAEGLVVSEARQVLVEETRIADAGLMGVALVNDAEVELRAVSVERCQPHGIFVEGATLRLVDSVVRDSLPDGSGSSGCGLSAQCGPVWLRCSHVTLERSLVIRNTDVGVYSRGGELIVTDSVVGDTRPSAAGHGGRGIQVDCDLDATQCPRLTVRGSVVERQRQAGIVGVGAVVEISSTVVRDHQGTGVGESAGEGIVSACAENFGVCGTMTISEALIERNGEAGVVATGGEVELRSSVVRSQVGGADGDAGYGILADCCVPGHCGSVVVEGSLLERNHKFGIATTGVDVTVRDSVVRDTQPDGNGDWGGGVAAQCRDAGDNCPNLVLERALVASNRTVGVLIVGADASVRASVIRANLPELSSGEFGRGLYSGCHDTGRCPRVTVEQAVIAANSTTGLFFSGTHAEVRSTVARDTAADAAGSYGRGIGAACDVTRGCGSLTVANSLLERNTENGVVVTCVDATILDTVIRDTQSRASDGSWGRGLHVQPDLTRQSCGSISVQGSLFSGNRDVAIGSFGMHTRVTGSHVRDTLPDDSGLSGRGINAQCDGEDPDRCGRLDVLESVVRSSYNLGVFTSGVPTTLHGVVVLDTRPTASGELVDDFGHGIYAMCESYSAGCETLELLSCLVESSHSAGVAVQGVEGYLEGSVIRSVAPRPLDGAFGYGLQIEGLESGTPAIFHVRSCQILDATLAGILYRDGGGVLMGTVVSGAAFAVVANQGSPVQLGEGNDLQGRDGDGLIWSSIDPTPAPSPALPLGL